MMTRWGATFFAFLMLNDSSYAEQGIAYENILTCENEDTNIRFDRYFVYAQDSVAQRTQIVVQGDLVHKLSQAGLGPTKPSGVNGEFIIDRLQLSLPSDGAYGNGLFLVIHPDGQWGEGMRVSLNSDQDAITIAYRGVSVSQDGLVCSRPQKPL